MQFILKDIEYTYPDAAGPAVSGVSATLPRGWTGLVGGNGCEKTTLARIACGQIEPDAGAVSPRFLPAYCPQSVLEPPEHLEGFAAAHDKDAIRLRRDLGIAGAWLWRYGELSSGQKARAGGLRAVGPPRPARNRRTNQPRGRGDARTHA